MKRILDNCGKTVVFSYGKSVAVLIMAMLSFAAVVAQGAPVAEGETIAWFSLDEDLLSIVNKGDNPDSMPTYIPEGGSITFNSYSAAHHVFDDSGTVVRESKYVTTDKSRVYIPLSKFDLGTDVTSITFEAFIRGDGRSSVNEVAAWDEVIWLDEPNGTNEQSKYPRNSSHRVFYIQDRDDASGKVVFRAGSNTSGDGVYDDSQVWLDGNWHHVAVTINGTAVTLYKDYAAVKSLTLGTSWSGSSSLHLVLGSRSGKSKLDFDEIRITKGVLAPTQFFCFESKSVMQDGDTLLYMPFDGNMTSVAGGLYEDYGPVQTGTPAYDADVWKNSVVEFGNNDVVIRGENTYSLKIDKTGAVTKTIRNPHLLTNAFDSATIEFFIKGPSDDADVALWKENLIFGKGWASETGKDKFGFLVQVDGTRKLFLRVDTDATSGYSSTATSPFAITDGKWHHFAITIEPVDGGAKTQMCYYFDYAEPVIQTKDGIWAGMKYGNIFSFGTSDSALWLDEFRITKGVLPKAKFMKSRNRGGFIVVFR